MQEPTWLDASFVERALRSGEQDESIKVSSVTVEPAIAKGINFASDIYRVNFEYSRLLQGHEITQTSSFIIKVTSDGDAWKEMLLNTGIFEREISMFTDTLRKMNQMLARLGMPSLSPHVVATSRQKPIYIAMEDLVPKGFQMAANLQAGLDLDHSLLVFRNLAVFHATSVALIEQEPMTRLTEHTKGFYHKDQAAMFIDFVNQNVKNLGEEVTKWPELSPRISEKILKLSNVAFEKACELSLFRKDDFNVLNHGDFSMYNTMFRYDEQHKPVELKFVDFQYSYYGSPVMDITYFFGASTSDEVRVNHHDLLLREYHYSLASTMEKLKCKTEVISLKDLQEIIRKHAYLEVITSLTILAVARSDRKSTESTPVSSEERNQRTCFDYGGKRYRKIITKLLPLYDSQGLLDV